MANVRGVAARRLSRLRRYRATGKEGGTMIELAADVMLALLILWLVWGRK